MKSNLTKGAKMKPFYTVSYVSKDGPAMKRQANHISCTSEDEARFLMGAFSTLYPDFKPLFSAITGDFAREDVPFVHSSHDESSAALDRFFKVEKWLQVSRAPEPLLMEVPAQTFMQEFSNSTGLPAVQVCDRY